MQAPTHARPQCVGCMGPREILPASYAFVAYFGRTTVEQAQQELFSSHAKMLPGVTMYCRACRSMQAVSTCRDLQEDLVSFAKRSTEWQEMHAVLSHVHMH